MTTKTYGFDISGHRFVITDNAESATPAFIYGDLKREESIFTSLNNPKVILDVGAHVGIISIYLSKLYPQSKIYAVEPYLPSYENLLKNILDNDCTNIIPVQIALSSDSKDTTMVTDIKNTGSCVAFLGIRPDKPIVKTCTLKQFMDDQCIEFVDFMKMDIEGSEYEVLPTFNEWERFKDIYIELHTLILYKPIVWSPLVKYWKDKLMNLPIKGKITIRAPEDTII